MCNYFIDNREELKGAKGKDGIIGEDGIPNWDSNVLNYPDNTLKCDNVNGYRRNLKGACFKEKLISDRIRKMNRNDSRLFWNVYDDSWCRIKKQRNNETFDDWKKRSIKMLLGVNANNEDKKKLDSIFEDKRIKNENFITKDDSDNLCSIICQNNINFEGLCNCRTRKSVNFNICNKPLEKTPWCDVVKRNENERNNDWSLRIYKVMTGRDDHQTSDGGVYHNSITVLKNKEYITKWDADKLCRNACRWYGKGINSENELPGCICEDIKNKYEGGRHNDQAKNWCNSLECRESEGYKSIKNERDKSYGNIENIRDKGYDYDIYSGWYDVQGCGKKTDYCRWVGDKGANHNPAKKTFIPHEDSSRSDGSWDCVIGDDQNVKMMYGATSTKFKYEKLDLSN